MQERVNFTPPPSTAATGGKAPPPTSWFRDNVVHFYQIKYAQELLSFLIDFLHQEDYQTIVKKMQEGKLTFSFAALQENGSAKEISETNTFNALQRQMGIELNYFTQLLQLLKKALPDEAETLSTLLSQMNQVIRQFPRLSQEELLLLNQGFAQLFDLIKKASPEAQSPFWSLAGEMVDKMVALNQKILAQLEEEMQNAKTKIKALEEVEKKVNSLLSLFGKGELKKGWEELTELVKKGKSLPPDLQKTVQEVLAKFEGIKEKGGTSLAKLCADSLLSRWVADQGGASRSPKEWASLLNDALAQPPFEGLRDSPFLSSVANHIHQTVRQPSFPEVDASLGASFSSPDEVVTALSAATPTPASLTQTEGAVRNALSAQGSQLRNRLVGYSGASEQLMSLTPTLGAAAALTASDTAARPRGLTATASAAPDPDPSKKSPTSGEALPRRFSDVILHKYLKEQQKELTVCAELLAFANMGGEIGNELLDLTSDFASASTNYNFSNSLHEDPAGLTPPQYSGDPDVYEKQRVTELSKAQQDQKNIKASQALIDQRIKDIQNNPSFTELQKKEMIGKLKPIQDELNTAAASMQTLVTTLSNMKVVKPATYDPKNPHFVVQSSDPNWKNSLSNAETAVVNGRMGSGGLTSIANQIDSFQKFYGSQSQTQQMGLQLIMTEMQQIWTTISTSMQILNQCYMTVAQGIYK